MLPILSCLVDVDRYPVQEMHPPPPYDEPLQDPPPGSTTAFPAAFEPGRLERMHRASAMAKAPAADFEAALRELLGGRPSALDFDESRFRACRPFDVQPGRTGRLFIYFRPEAFNQRNLPENVWDAAMRFCDTHEGFELYLVGTVRTAFSFERHGNRVFVISKLPPASYVSLISSCDAVVALIYPPHPGVIAYQAAASGIPTVTNTFENRTADDLRRISDNIVPFDP